ncbi:spore germination protein KA [Gracilibacillus orientalis]|uniref:Spore germination protein KA n=2 Tax=Gracilibacillus orientalis TaxID=334253 RepID=A0A1I4NDG3_9BACI|nr:spore germination protein KA [Gracilibacillus orientalis]
MLIENIRSIRRIKKGEIMRRRIQKLTKKKTKDLNSKALDQKQKKSIISSLEESIKYINETLGNSDDFIVRKIRIGKEEQINIGIFYIDGLVDTQKINDFVIEPLMFDFQDKNIHSKHDLLTVIKDSTISVGDIEDVTDYGSLLSSLASGQIIILVDGFTKGFTIGLTNENYRGVTEPSQETVVRGPKEGFTETLRTNTALIRRKINSPNLRVETRKIGEVTQTQVSIMYIRGIVNEKVLEEVRTRLSKINIDGLLESNYIEELIQDKTFSPFPTMYNTERPDVVSACLLEGRVAILVNGTPFVLLVPSLFIQFFQAAEDHYQRWDFSTFIRFLRIACFFITLLAPSLFIAITTYHQEMIPTQLLISLAAQREGVPFPAFIEALLMEITFEILREGGIRMPKAVGQAISIVGTLVIGTAAVEAGFISAAMVIIVAITAIASFVIPAHNMSISIRLIRFLFMGLAASFGLFGITAAFIGLILHLCSIRSFGIPYMSPFGPYNVQDQKDSLFRLPLWRLSTRPRLINQQNINREQSPSPKPPSKK